MASLWHDFRYGLRGLRNQPSFTLLAMLALALGIGAATTIFSVIQNVLLDPFPYTNAEKVVSIQIHDVANSRPGGRTFFQLPEFLDYQEQSHVFEEVIGGSGGDALITNGEGTELFSGGEVTPNMFRFLGVPAQLGRILTPDDARPDAPPVFVMSYKMWTSRHNQDPKILGRSFVINGVPSTLVGIMPMRFTKLGSDLWRAVSLSRSDPENKQRYFMFQARLKPGVTLPQAQSEIEVIAHRLATVYPNNYPKKFTVQIISWLDSLVSQFRATLYTLAAAVGLLLLIACTNVANMLLAKATAREKEIALRSSLGASRWRLIRQLLVESLLLALGGAAVGCLLAYGGIKAVVAAIPDGAIPREAVISLNVPVLLFSLGIACVTAVLFGLAPAVQMARRDIVEPLKDSGKGVSGGFRHGKLRAALVVIEVALSLVLLVGAGLLMRSFVRLQQVDLGLNPKNIYVAYLPLPKGQYKTPESKFRFFRTLLPRLQALPGVVAAAETSSLPPYGGIGTEIDIPGKAHSEKWTSIFQLCSEGYFSTLQLKLLRGRTLSEVEVNDARKVAVVNQTLVNKYFGNEDPMGRRIKINMLEKVPDGPIANPLFEIIGVVADAKNRGIQETPEPEMFIPYTVTGMSQRGILVRTEKDPKAMMNAIRGEIWKVDRNIAVGMSDSLEAYLERFSYAGPRFSLILLGIFAGVGLLLVGLGVYSVVAYTVSRQTHEIGIRMALGAGAPDVLRMVLRMGLRLIAIGMVAGLFVSLGAARLIASQVWGISIYDPVTLATVLGVVGAAGVAACYFPARRATRVDPLIALRYE